MRIHLLAGARPFERAREPVRSALRGQGLANLTLPGLAALIPRHHSVVLQDEQCAPVDLDAPMDLAMVTTKACYAPRAYQLADRLRERGVPVVLGGCHASLNPDEAATHCDALVVGEAEDVMPRLLDDARAARLQPRYMGQQADMSRVPWPRRDLLQKHYMTSSLTVSRGCNYACRFCCIRGFYGTGFRARPVDDVVREVRRLGPFLGFLDENLVADGAYARELFTALIPQRRRWLAQVSSDIVHDPELIDLAARSGARGFHIGFETINPRNLEAEGKGHNDVAAYQELIDRCRRAGIMLAAGIIFGLEGDTEDVFPETLEALGHMGVDLCYFKMATPYPGTDFYTRMERQGRILTRDWSWYDGCFPVFEPPGMTARQLFEGTRGASRRFYSVRSVAARLGNYRKLKIPLWAAINLNRLATLAYRHSVVQGEQFLRSIGQ